MKPSNKYSLVCADAACAVLRGYRAVLSLDHGIAGSFLKRSLPCGLISSGCRFVPSCSAYAEAAIRQYGLAAGAVVSLGRILRCRPGNPGGYDPVDASQ